jgi:hypothetical protein
MFDVFYFGPKPNLFAFEKPAASLAEAQSLSKTRYYWYIYGDNDYTGFNFDFVPAPWESNYTHVWADQHQPNGNVYLTANADADLLYHNEAVHRLGDLKCWYIPNYIDPDTVDYRWSPDPASPPYIYHFPSQWQSASGVTYTVPGATEIKLVSDFVVRSCPRNRNWYIPDNISSNSIEWSWHPNVLDPPTTYHFPVQWNWDNIGGPEYRVPIGVGDKYINDFVAKTIIDMTNWHVPANINKETFDFSWQPHPADPPFIYKFPTVWNSEGGPEYRVPGATQEKYMSDIAAETLPDMTNWTVPEEVNANEVDFSWVPHPKDPPYIYHFGTDFQQSVGLTYTVPGATEIKFAGPIPVRGQQTALEVLDIFYIDHGNDTATTRFELLSQYNPIKVRYANSMIDTIKRCANRACTNKFWVISSEYDYTNFNFAWHPAPWQNYMTHVFPSQHQKWSNTFLINRAEFERNIKWATSLEEFPNLNFVSDQQVVRTENRYTIYYIDHGNDVSRHQYEYLRADCVRGTDIVMTRFVDNYLDTFKRIMATAQTEYVWILNSICNYTAGFDFTWEPEPWQREMIHVFPTGFQKRGDTFYIHVESFKKQMVELELLDWFNVINYCDDQTVERFDTPVIYYDSDNLVGEIKKYKFETPYAMFTNQRDLQIVVAPCLWTEKDRVIERCSESGATTLVPRDVKKYIKTQLYDYPYNVNSNFQVREDQLLDIVYISNGEPDAERWYNHLLESVYGNPLRPEYANYRVKRVQNVNGRTAAYQAAARASTTPWFFTVFAKLEVNRNFDWSWQPDYWQEPKHYIFNALNPVNGLEYGHQAMIAYNKNLVLANNNPGIDFTLSQPHESVPILSGTAHFNQDPWMTWRTAFREVLKLRLFQDTQPTLENDHRLNVWLTNNTGIYSNYAKSGAEDAVAYYEEVNGDLDQLQLSFEWAWLRERFNASTR